MEAVIHMKPSERKEGYAAVQEVDNRTIREEKRQKKRDEKRKRQAKVLHWMKCPKCGMDLIERDYKHVKVDMCAHCDGIWFDAGEMAALTKMDKTGIDRLFSVVKK
jgi:acetyl-CoA carboxylase beta subunit